MKYEVWISEDEYVEKLKTFGTKKEAEIYIEKYRKYYYIEEEKFYIEEVE